MPPQKLHILGLDRKRGLFLLASHEELVDGAVDRICTAWNLGMFSGYDAAGTFGANDTITRAQLCQALYNMGFTAENCILN